MKVLAFGEVMLRLTPPSYKRIEQTDMCDLSFSGTGMNILSGLSHAGISTELFTVLPENSVGRAASAAVRRLGINAEKIEFQSQHIGTYFLEMGYGNRPSNVTYLNRDQSSFCTTILSQEVLEDAVNDTDLVHICGISLATSEISRKNALKLANVASRLGKKVCFDFNFRPSLVGASVRPTVMAAYKEMLQVADFVSGGFKDLTLLLEMEFDAEKQTIDDLFKRFVRDYDLQAFFGTEKNNSGDTKTLQGFYATSTDVTRSIDLSLTTFDRIGTGDAYVSGILTGLLSDWPIQEVVDYASKSAQIAFTTFGDSPIVTKDEIFQMLEDESLEVIR
ncbi:MAG: sugar kinase [Streptococcaceae bacterium]|jgi:2-dehydro-3-deoxygluconokinase|nr:sugar kinase [Streptococcaceae bacterium]